jgi:hypothetical protein
MSPVTWILEPDIFPDTHAPIRAAIRDLGFTLVDWSDLWWSDGVPTTIPSTQVVFHGSLGNAARIATDLGWSPGSFCPVDAFHCSAWYESARPWLIHADWHFASANKLVADAKTIGHKLGSTDRLFIRPDSPLKPFGGRVVDVDRVSLATLDHGFYYEDESIPVVAAPVRQVGDEWRFVVVNRNIVAGSGYDTTTRRPIAEALDSAAGAFAADIASSLPPPAEVYILDVCECDGELRLLELNPFGGADLYACNPVSVVRAVSAVAMG